MVIGLGGAEIDMVTYKIHWSLNRDSEMSKTVQ